MDDTVRNMGIMPSFQAKSFKQTSTSRALGSACQGEGLFFFFFFEFHLETKALRFRI